MRWGDPPCARGPNAKRRGKRESRGLEWIEIVLSFGLDGGVGTIPRTK